MTHISCWSLGNKHKKESDEFDPQLPQLPPPAFTGSHLDLAAGMGDHVDLRSAGPCLDTHPRSQGSTDQWDTGREFFSEFMGQRTIPPKKAGSENAKASQTYRCSPPAIDILKPATGGWPMRCCYFSLRSC